MAKRRRLYRENLEPPRDRFIKIRTKFGAIHIARYLKGDNEYEGWYLCSEGYQPVVCSNDEIGVIAYTTSISSNDWHHFYKRRDVDRSLQRGLLPGEKPDKEEKEA